MSRHLFGSITVPNELDHIVDIHRLHIDRGRGVASLLDGWRAFLRHQRDVGPMAFLSAGAEHLEHFGAQVSNAVDELVRAPWGEVVALAVTIQSLRSVPVAVDDRMRSGLPDWLVNIENRSAVQASVRNELQQDGPTPWVIEVDFGTARTSCANVWINPDGSLYQLYSSDETVDELETFLGEINHLTPNRPFTRVSPAEALHAIVGPANHPATAMVDATLLRWLVRTPAHSAPT